MFCPKVVLSCLLKEFGPCNVTRAPSRKEQKVVDSFASILRYALFDNLVIDCEEDAVVEEDGADPLWTGEDEEFASVGTQGSIRFSYVEVSEEKVKEAMTFYRSSVKGSRPLSVMKNRFRFLNSEYHLKKLRQFERERELSNVMLLGLLKLKEQVLFKMSIGVPLHDNDIRQMALNINREESLVENFKASHRWIQNFKKSCGIVSRRITTFISRKNFLDQDRVFAEAQRFVSGVKKEMESWPLERICNADQSAFLKELHSSRSLAIRGSQKVQRIVQSVSATTHSFTIMPSLFADGHLGEKLFVVMQEVNGKFPDKGYFQTPNLEVRAISTHIMNKQLMIDWVQACVVPPSSPPTTLLIIDSWSSFKDHVAIQSVLPEGEQVKVMNIPSGATAQIQPLDVYFFLPFKAMYKRFKSYIIAHNCDFRVYHRDSIFRILSLVYHQFRAPRFRNFLRYAWYAAGYLEEHPGPFETPIQYCFSPDLMSVCNCVGCDVLAFIRCSHCEQQLCFDHFVLDYHICS